MKRRIANLLAASIAVLGGAYAIYKSYGMREPQGAFDWLALVFTGVIVGLIAFFLVWGHFQSDPQTDQARPAHPVVTDRDQPAGEPPQRS
jgi:hypothetical protein